MSPLFVVISRFSFIDHRARRPVAVYEKLRGADSILEKLEMDQAFFYEVRDSLEQLITSQDGQQV